VTDALPDDPQAEEAIRPLRIVNVLLRARWLIVTITIVVTAATAGFVMTLEPTFTATAKFMPSQGRGASTRLSTVAGVGAMQSDIVVENTAPEYYSELLTSYPFLKTLVDSTFDAPTLGGRVRYLDTLNLESTDESTQERQAIEAARKRVNVAAVKMKNLTASPIISVTMTAPDPLLAAQSANSLVEQLIAFNKEFRGSTAMENKKFVEGQLADAGRLLRQAEESLAEFNRLNRKIATPDIQAELERRTRAVKVQEEVFIELSRQVELARIQAQEDRVSIEILEPAIAPTTRSAPKRTQSVIIAAFIGLIGACVLAVSLDKWRSADRDDPDVADLRVNMRAVIREMTFGLLGRSQRQPAGE
jgi:uncharacterized protein involved in exopolysaccharide biosynthesis